MQFKNNEILLFQGDSITDGNRGRGTTDPNHYIGHSFPYILSAHLALKYIDKNPSFLSRGISGNDLLQMYARWREDGINLKPTVISILIGTNDAGAYINANNGSTQKQYEHIFRTLIDETLNELPDTRFVLCEPFYMNVDGTDTSERRYNDIKSRAQIVKKIAEDYNSTYVPLQDLLDSYAKKLGNKRKILWDGVHPTILGHSIIAEQWLKITEL